MNDSTGGCGQDCGTAKARIEEARENWGWEPHPTQREWLLCEADVKVAACGRRWGKTEAEAYDAAAFAILNRGSVQMIVSPSYDQSRLIFRKVEQLILGHKDLKEGAKCVKTPYPLLTLKSGSTISARTADDDGRNLRGHYADRVIVDEAAYVRDEVIEEVISPMLADKNGKLVLISTPFGHNHFYRAFVRGQEEGGRYKSFRFPSWENPHISREYIESQRETITERQFSVEYEAEFLDDQNSVFRWSDVQAALRPGTADLGFGVRGSRSGTCGSGNRQELSLSPNPQPRTPPSDRFLVAGVDWARYSDYTAVVVVDAWASPMEVVEIDRFNLLSWETQVERVAQLVERLKIGMVLMDQTSIGDPLLEQTRRQIWERHSDIGIEGFVFTNTSKRELIDHLGIRLSRRQLLLPNDERLIKELQYFEYELTPSGSIRMNAKRGHNDDLVIALALAVQAASECPEPMRILTSGIRKI